MSKEIRNPKFKIRNIKGRVVRITLQSVRCLIVSFLAAAALLGNAARAEDEWIVLRGGEASNATPPSYAELDGLEGLST